MFCPKCGNMLADNMMFCNNCGMKVQDSILKAFVSNENIQPLLYGPPEMMTQRRAYEGEQNVLKNKSNKEFNKLIIPVIILAVLLIASSVLLFLNIGEKASGGGADMGFDSPEEALQYYIDCFKSGDIEGALSVCAINHITENFSNEAQVERLKVIQPNVNFVFRDNAMVENISREVVRSTFVTDMYRQYWKAAGVFDRFEGKGIILDENSSAKELLAEIFPEGIDKKISSIDVVKYMRPEEVLPEINSENYVKYCDTMGKVYGGDNYSSICAMFYYDGTPCLLACDTIEYDSKTYICSLRGYIAILYGTDIYSGGICVLGD